MWFGVFGILPVGVISQRLYGALALIQAIILVITASTVVNVLWMCLGPRRRTRGSKAVRARPAQHRNQEPSALRELEPSRRV